MPVKSAYAGDESGSQLEIIVKQLEYLIDRKWPIGEELMAKIGVVMHQLKMGR